MSIHWTLKLVCEGCGADVTFEDEKPEWKRDEELVAQIEAAEAFVAEHKETPYREVPRPLPPYVIGNCFVGLNIADYPSFDYIECPACGDKCRKGSGEQER